MPINLRAVLICTSHFTGRTYEVIKFKGKTADCERKGKRVSQQAFPKLNLPHDLCQNTSLTLCPDGFLKAFLNVCCAPYVYTWSSNTIRCQLSTVYITHCSASEEMGRRYNRELTDEISLIDNICTHFHTYKSNADHQSQTLRGSNTLSCIMQTQQSVHIEPIIVHLPKYKYNINMATI